MRGGTSLHRWEMGMPELISYTTCCSCRPQSAVDYIVANFRESAIYDVDLDTMEFKNLPMALHEGVLGDLVVRTLGILTKG